MVNECITLRVMLKDLYRSHLETLSEVLVRSLHQAADLGFACDGVILHSGRVAYYYQDDQQIRFRVAPHLSRYVPLKGPEHLVLARPLERLKVVRVTPRDYWYEVPSATSEFWCDAVDLMDVSSFEEALKVLPRTGKLAYIGNSPIAAAELGITAPYIDPPELLAPLDWYRAMKTPYEIECLKEAAKRAAKGHAAVRDAFLEGASERELHVTYLRASGQLEEETPFENIVALNEKPAILHYQNKRRDVAMPHHTVLLDAGASSLGYASDISRTWAAKSVHPVYHQLLAGLDTLQRELVSLVAPKRPYLDIHLSAHQKIAQLLIDVGLGKGSVDNLVAVGVTRTFMPHGVGHHLGLQVHDIGGRQASLSGGTLQPPPEYPSLRNLRPLEEGHVVTIEPGIYFIPLLLSQLRQPSNIAALLDWSLVDALLPYGGMRIEDDIVCTKDGPLDLTRPYIEGPRGS